MQSQGAGTMRVLVDANTENPHLGEKFAVLGERAMLLYFR
jgi:hypothetical protein